MTSVRERASVLLLDLLTLSGTIPRDLRMMFECAGVRLQYYMYEPRPLRPPCSALVKGRPCKNKCCPDQNMCRIHLHAQQRTPPVRCCALTAKGEQCKSSQYKTCGMCKRHARKEGRLPDVPTDCPICYEALTSENRFETACGHFFHKGCLQEYSEVRGRTRVGRNGVQWAHGPCPMCRAPFRMKLPAQVQS
jgi:hypothetical protein